MIVNIPPSRSGLQGGFAMFIGIRISNKITTIAMFHSHYKHSNTLQQHELCSFPKKWRIFGQNYLMQQFAVLLLKANIYKKIQFGPQRLFKDVHTKKRESLGVCCLFTRVFKVKIVWTPSFTPHPCTLHNILLTMMIILTIMVVTLQGPWGCRGPNA